MKNQGEDEAQLVKYHETVTVKYLFDYVKNTWNIPVGAPALGIGLFGYILQNATLPSYLRVVFGIGSLVGIGFFIWSINLGISAQRNLLGQIIDSERGQDAKEANNEDVEEANNKELVSLLNRSQNKFSLGCCVLASVAIAFLVSGPIAATRKTTDEVTVSLKDLKVSEADSRTYEIQNMTLKVQGVGRLLDSKTLEIKGSGIKVQVVENDQ